MRVRAGWLALLVLAGATSCSRDPDVAKRKFVEIGNKYFARGKYKEASIMYRNALKTDRRYGEAYYRLGLAEIQSGKPVPAIHAFRRAVGLLPDNEDARVKLADLYLLSYAADPAKPKRLREEIARLIEQILNKNPNSFEGLRLKGHLAWRDRDLATAIESFQAADRVKPHDRSVVLALCQVLAENDQFDKGEELAKGLLERYKDFGPVYDVLYMQYARRNRLEDAEKIRLLKVNNNPKEARYVLELARHYYAVNRPEDAVRALQRMTSNTKDFPNAHRDAGDLCFGFGAYDQAMSFFREAARRSEGNEKLACERRIVETMIAQGNAQEAARHLAALLKDHPKNPDLLALRASTVVSLGDRRQIQAAVKELEALVLQQPENPVTRYHLGRAYWMRHRIDLAQMQFQEAIRLRGDYVAPRLALSQIYLDKKDFGAALRVAEEAIKLVRGNVAAYLLRAHALAGLGKQDQARSSLLALARRFPDSAEVLSHLGRLELNMGSVDAAERTLSECHKRTGDLRCLLGLADSLAARGQDVRAIELLQDGQISRPRSPDLKLAIAKLAVKTGKYDLAQSLYKELVAADPDSSDLHVRLGNTCSLLGDRESALRSYQKARELNPDDPGSYLPLATVLTSLGRMAEAKAIYEQLLKLQPDNAAALNNLAYILAETAGDLDLALTYAQRAKQKMPRSPQVSDTLGWIYVRKKLTSNAIAVYRELLAQHPNHSTYRYHLAAALLQKGDKPQARKELEAALRNKPSAEEAGKIRELMAEIATGVTSGS